MPFREQFRYFTILDGASLTNEDEAAASPRYYGYTRPGGSYIIMRRIDAGSGTFQYEFKTNKGPQEDANGNPITTQYDADWANRDSLTYQKAAIFQKL